MVYTHTKASREASVSAIKLKLDILDSTSPIISYNFAQLANQTENAHKEYTIESRQVSVEPRVIWSVDY